MMRRDGLTLIELLITIVVITIVLSLFLPLLADLRRRTSGAQKNLVLVGIHEGLYQYASGNGDYYPGLDASGDVVDVTVEGRYVLLMNGGFIPSDYLISPLEDKTAWTGGSMTTAHYSFAMLAIDSAKGMGRRNEWRLSWNNFVPLVSDRNTGADHDKGVASLDTGNDVGQWEGQVLFNGGYTTVKKTHVMHTKFTKVYEDPIGSMEGREYFDVNRKDNIFTDETEMDSDAYMIYEGE